MTYQRAAVMVIAVLIVAAPAWAQSLDPRAESILDQAASYVAGLESFAFRVEETHDEVDEDGRRLRHSNIRNMAVRRPNRLVSDVDGDLLSRIAFYDGRRLSLFDKRHNVYATLELKGSLDDALDHVADEYDVVFPLAELAYSDPKAALFELVQTAEYVGLGHVMGRQGSCGRSDDGSRGCGLHQGQAGASAGPVSADLPDRSVL